MSTNQSNSKPNPASHGDELDVYQALHTIEQETGKKLLSPEQLQTLISSGRINFDNQNTPGNQSKNKSTNVIELILYGLEKHAFEEVQFVLGDEFWESLNDIQKKKMAFDYFLVLYGLSPDTIRNKLAEYFEEKR